MIRWLALIVLFLASPALAQNCAGIKSGLDADRKPQNTGRDIVGKSLDDIIDRGWMLFAVYEDFPPFSYKSKGKLSGVDIDLGNLIAADLGVEARFVATQADESVDGDLRNNVWKGKLIGGKIANVMLHIPYDRELGCRNEQVVLNGQYYNEQLGIAFRTEEYPDGGPTPAYFRFDKVGVENDTISDFYLSSFAGGQVAPNVTRYTTPEEAMTALAAGEISAVMAPLSQLEHGLTDGMDVHTPAFPGLAKHSWTLGVAVRHNWRPLSYAVDDAIRMAVDDGRMKGIFEKHGLTYTTPDW